MVLHSPKSDRLRISFIWLPSCRFTGITGLKMTIDDQKALLDRPVGVDDEESMTNSKHIRVGKLALASLLLGGLLLRFDGKSIPPWLTFRNAACFLANADESFILTTGSDVAAALEAPDYTSWLITSYNLGYTTALPLVRPFDHHVLALWLTVAAWPSMRFSWTQKGNSYRISAIWIRLYFNVRSPTHDLTKPKRKACF